MTELHALLERCQSVQWPDREIDARVWLAVTHPEMRAFHDGVMLRYSKDGQPPFEYQHDTNIPHYSGSIDRAVSLVEEILPALPAAEHKKSEITVRFGDWGSAAKIDRDTFGGDHVFRGAAQTPALAILAALLQALIAKASSHGGEG